MTRRDAESMAWTASRQDGETRYVVTIDHADGRTYAVMTSRGISGDEFAAFAGRIEAEVPSSGDIVWF